MTAQRVAAARGERTTRVLVAVAVRFYREGLALALGRRRWIEVVGTASGVVELFEQLERTRPDVVLIDFPAADGAHAVRAIRESHPGTGVVALEVDEACAEALALVEAGVASVVDRESSITDIVSSVIATAQGHAVVTPRVAELLLERVRRLGSDGHLRVLTEREKDVAELIESGLSNKQIASRLSIEVPTVKNHVHHILEKLNVSRRGEAAAELRRQR